MCEKGLGIQIAHSKKSHCLPDTCNLLPVWIGCGSHWHTNEPVVIMIKKQFRWLDLHLDTSATVLGKQCMKKSHHLIQWWNEPQREEQNVWKRSWRKWCIVVNWRDRQSWSHTKSLLSFADNYLSPRLKKLIRKMFIDHFGNISALVQKNFVSVF